MNIFVKMIPFQVQQTASFQGEWLSQPLQPNATKVPRKGSIFQSPLWRNRWTNLMPGVCQRSRLVTWEKNKKNISVTWKWWIFGCKKITWNVRIIPPFDRSRLIHHMVVNWSITEHQVAAIWKLPSKAILKETKISANVTHSDLPPCFNPWPFNPHNFQKVHETEVVAHAFFSQQIFT